MAAPAILTFSTGPCRHLNTAQKAPEWPLTALSYCYDVSLTRQAAYEVTDESEKEHYF